MTKLAFNVLAVVAIALFLGASTKAEEGKYKAYYGWHAVGNMEELDGGGAKKFTGTLHGTSFNEGGFGHLFSVVCPIINNISAEGVMDASGTCKMTDVEGNTIDLTWNCKGAPKCEGTFTFTGGTVKYAAISGENNFYAAFITGTEGYSWWDGQFKY